MRFLESNRSSRTRPPLRKTKQDASKEARDPGPRKDPRSLREEQFLDTEEGTRSSAETEEEATGGGRRGAYRPSNLHPPVCRRAGGDHRHEEGRDSVPRRGADTCDGLRVPLEGISGRDGIPRSPEEYLPDSSTSRGLGRDLDGEGARRRPRDGEGPDTDRRGAFAEKATGRRGLYRDAGGPRVEAEEDWREGRSPRRRREVEEVEEERRGYPRKGRGREEEEEMEEGRRAITRRGRRGEVEEVEEGRKGYPRRRRGREEELEEVEDGRRGYPRRRRGREEEVEEVEEGRRAKARRGRRGQGEEVEEERGGRNARRREVGEVEEEGRGGRSSRRREGEGGGRERNARRRRGEEEEVEVVEEEEGGGMASGRSRKGGKSPRKKRGEVGEEGETRKKKKIDFDSEGKKVTYKFNKEEVEEDKKKKKGKLFLF